VTRPYDGYQQLALPRVPVRDAGDAQARMQVRIGEIHAAFHLASRAITRLPDGDPDRLRVEVVARR
jgi:NADH:ubiquinone oxidoreductase subunit D